MKKLVVVGWVVALLGIGGVAVPALCQNFGFEIQQPDFTNITSGFCNIRWKDALATSAPPANITWYYSTNPNGSDRRRMGSIYRDDFSRPIVNNWRATGPFITDWSVHQDGREKRQILSGNRDAGPCVSKEQLTGNGNVVLSVLVKPQWIRNSFTLGLRTQEGRTNDGFFIHNDGTTQQMTVERVDKGVSTPLGAAPLKDAVFAQKWYWYEFSLRTARTEVEVRVRVFDEKHQRVLASFGPVTDKFSGRSPLLRSGGISLGAPADYAEVYVDPWEARWTDRGNGEFRWNTEGVPAGEYFLVAEIADDRRRSQPIVSQFKLDIRGAGAAQMQALKSEDH